jgi:osmotically-inducible protein OsmY
MTTVGSGLQIAGVYVNLRNHLGNAAQTQRTIEASSHRVQLKTVEIPDARNKVEDGTMAAATLQHSNDLTARIRRELISDPRVVGLSVETSVNEDNDEVTLSGTVKTYAAKLYAEDAARRIAEARGVTNRIEVKIPPHEFKADKEVAEVVRYTFRWNVLLPANSIDCVVVGGWVLLTGKVSAQYQKLEAEIAISHVAGVRGIVNDIEIAAPMD